MSKPNCPTTTSRRLNLRALAILAAAIVTLVPGLIWLNYLQQQRGRTALLREARGLIAKNQPGPALGYLNRYLELSPRDATALDLKAKLLFDAARDPKQAQDAAQVHSQVLGMIPEASTSQETRRRMVKLNLMIPGRAPAAEALAREMIKRGADDAEIHRLLAQALELVSVVEKQPAIMEEARLEYEKAEREQPGDIDGAEQLAQLYRVRLENKAKALEVLDHLVGFTAGVPKKHAAALLARARHFLAVHEPAKARADVDQALGDDPSDVEVRLAASEMALQRHDTFAARQHLSAIDPAQREDLRIKISEGVIDLVEQRPEDAIRHWRSGLVKSGGTDADLTWRLAHVLLESGRVAEAEPLIEQYYRLVGGESPPARYRYLRSLALIKTNRMTTAIPELEAIRYKVDKTLEPHVYYALGQAYELTRDPVKALEAYRQAAEHAEDWSAPWTAVARLQLATKPTEALATLQKGLALNRNDPRLLAALAGLLWREQMQKPKSRRSWGEVEQMIARAKSLNPGASDIALIESDYYEATDRADDAISLLETATGLNPRSNDLWLARANALARHGQLANALAAVDQAIKAAGPQAGFYITRASLLVLKGQVTEAGRALRDGLERAPTEQRPVLWKTLGEFAQARGDAKEAESAFEAWSKLQPDNPEPSLAQVEIAIARGDEAAIARTVEAVRNVGGANTYHWRLARVEALLRDRGKETPDSARDAKRLDEAETLIKEIQNNDPRLPLGYLLEGRLREKRKQVDQAIVAYESALKLNAGQLALTPLVTILVREGREADLKRLREKLAEIPGDFDRLAAVQALRQGNASKAEQLAALAIKGDPQGIDTRVWQAEVLQALGKPDAAATALKLIISQQPNLPTPWLQLLMLEVSQGKRDEASATVEQMRAQVQVESPELLWALCYRAIGDIPRAAEYYQQARKRWPGDVPVIASAVSFYDQIGRRDEAEEALRAILSRDPSNRWAIRKLALSRASRTGNCAAWNEAVTLIGANARPDDLPDDHLVRANVFSQGPEPADRAKGIAILEALLAEMPNLNVVHDQVARLYYTAGDLARAREHAAKAVEGKKATPNAVVFYAGILLALNDLDNAEGQLARLNSLSGADGLQIAELRARVLTARGQGSEGAKQLERAFEDRAKGPEGLVLAEKIIRLLKSLAQPEAAERVARRAAELGPRGKCLLAELLASRDNTEETARLLNEAAKAGDPAGAFTTALSLAAKRGADPRWLDYADRFRDDLMKLHPDSIDLLDKTAYLRHLQRRYDDEIKTYQAMLSKNPDNPLFLNNMAWTLSEEMSKPEEGLARADEAIKRSGPLPHILDTRGVILTRLGRLDEAIKSLEPAARDLHTGKAYFHLARAYAKQGKSESARQFGVLADKAGLSREQLSTSEQADWDAIMNVP